jgi:GNAT superfamily N-acetyltransferase
LIFDAFASIHDRHNFPRDFQSVDSAMQLAGWFISQPQKFWGVLAVRPDPDGGKVIGCNFLDLRNLPVPGVGPVCVHPAEQGTGVGKAVMRAVIDRAQRVGATSVRLVQDAFNTCSMSLYSGVGFEVRDPLALMQGQPASRAISNGGATARLMREDDLAGCAELCRRVHGFDRTGELRDALTMFRPVVLERAGRITAYASAPGMWLMNHGVAQAEQDLKDLLIGAAAVIDGPLSLLIPMRRAGLLRWCLGERLRMVKPMTLMTRGEYREPTGWWWPSVQY